MRLRLDFIIQRINEELLIRCVFVQYFRQCIRLPPPNVPPQSHQCRSSHTAGSPPALRHSVPSTPTSNQAGCYASRRAGGTNKSRNASSSALSADASGFPSLGPVQCGKAETGSELTRSLSEPLDEGKRQQRWTVQHGVDGVQMMTSGLMLVSFVYFPYICIFFKNYVCL